MQHESFTETSQQFGCRSSLPVLIVTVRLPPPVANMDTDLNELETSPSEPRESWREVAVRSLRRRWVQVVLVLFGSGVVMLVSGLILAPKAIPKAVDPKFLYCPKCEFEMRYDVKYDGEPCNKCRDEPVGTFEARDESVKKNGKSRWRWVYLAIALEAIATLGGVVYLLYRPAHSSSTTYYVFSCPHCGQRLRFRHVSLGGLGQCTRCKRPVRFPGELEAVREEDLIREEEERLAAEQDDDDDEE